jgi:hypothetical protein
MEGRRVVWGLVNGRVANLERIRSGRWLRRQGRKVMLADLGERG